MVLACGAMSCVLPRGCGCSNDLSHGSDAVNAKGGPHTGSYKGLCMWDPGGIVYSLKGLLDPPPPQALKEYLQMLEDDWKDFDSKLKRSFGLL